jgi:hypothetical protein
LAKLVVLVPFNERGYERLCRLLERIKLRAYLPLPKPLCEPWQRELFLGRIPSSFLRVWSPLLDLLSRGLPAGYTCYLELEDVEAGVEASLRIAALVLKARALGVVRVEEWLSAVPKPREPPLASWEGALVVDSFLDYYVLVKKGAEGADVVSVDSFVPTPVDLLSLVSAGLLEWKCPVEELIRWAVWYIGDAVVTSSNLTEAYDKLVGSEGYRELVEECTRQKSVLLYW